MNELPSPPAPPPPAALLATIIVPFYNASETIARCAASLWCLKPGLENQFAVLFVDDCSTDDSLKLVEKCGWPVARLEKHSGAGAARNLGAQLAATPWLVFIDADCLVDLAWAQTLLGYLARPGSGAVASQYRGWAGNQPIQRLAYWELKYREAKLPATLAAASTCNFAVRRDLFAACGGFSEDPSLTGAEDLEFSWRLSRRTPITWAPEMGVVHIFKPTLSGYLRQQHNYARSGAMFALRHQVPKTATTLQDRSLAREVAASAALAGALAACASPLAPLALPATAALCLYLAQRAFRQSAYLAARGQYGAALLSLGLTVPRNASWVAGAAAGVWHEATRRRLQDRTPRS